MIINMNPNQIDATIEKPRVTKFEYCISSNIVSIKNELEKISIAQNQISWGTPNMKLRWKKMYNCNRNDRLKNMKKNIRNSKILLNYRVPPKSQTIER